MYTNILQFLENTVQKLPDKKAYISENATLTYQELFDQSRQVGSHLAKMLPGRSAVAIFMSRDVWYMNAILGTIYAGCFCAPLDAEMPAERVYKIFETLEPRCIIADDSAKRLLDEMGEPPCPVVWYEDAVAEAIDEELLAQRRRESSMFDPIEIFYTSGSTGMPKGVVYTHNNMIAYATYAAPTHDVDENQRFGNQAPFFYANVVWDMYVNILIGATAYFTPSDCFLLPRRFLEYFNENKLTTVTMTPLNFIYIADSGILEPGSLPHLESIYMCGEAVPYDKMKIWRDAAPNAHVVNFYAATESPYMAEYYLDQNVFDAGSLVPAGNSPTPVKALLLDENGEEVEHGQAGELYVSSPWLSSGYYNDPELTDSVFVNNPLNGKWRQTFYRTGDIGRFNEKNELCILGRQDTMIKHRGFRMDTGEVEAALRSIEGWQNGCILFDQKEDRLWCFWCGPLTEEEIKAALADRIEKYMYPNYYVHLDEIPRTLNGKMDRTALKKEYFGG